MKKLHKGLLIGGVTLAALVPAGLVAADQLGNGNGNGNGNGRGNGTMTNDCTRDQVQDRIQTRDRLAIQTQDRIQARDGTGANHVANEVPTTTTGDGAQHQTGPMDGTGPQADRPLDGTGNQFRSGK